MAEAATIKAIAQAERAEFERLRMAVEASRDVVYDWDLATDAVIWSANVKQAFGLSDAIDIATRTRFIARVNGEDLASLTRLHREHKSSRAPFQIEYRLRRGDGEFCWVEDRGMTCFSPEGEPERVIGSIRIITSHKQREAQLEWLTTYDELTGHYNRTRLREALDHQLSYAERYEAPGAYLTVAVDDLPLISDSYGHEVADAVIVAVGQALDQCMRASDIIGRVAQDQFGIVIGACTEKDVQATADKILAKVQRATVRSSGGPVHLVASVGGVTFPGTVRTAHDAMTKADVALEHARRIGRNRFIAYNLTEEQRRDQRHGLAIAKQVQTALQTGDLVFAFQPIVCSATREVRAYECLLRMRESRGRYVPAGDFLHVAEETGLIRLIDRKTLEMAVSELSAAPDITLALNISGLTTTDPAWLRRLFALVKGRRDIAQRLIVEITETAALHDIEETMRFVAAVRDVGCRIALDDFGAGYTSFRHLKALAVDVVKIDGSFITNLVDQPQDFLFVKTLQDLARGFGLQTVAECIETEEVADLLAREGIDFLQGYYFGKPSLERPWEENGPDTNLRDLAVGVS
ncbi:MAG: putative bifunctional diguanylate cyclase/phosphodiesterase [Alphaproteobacteria bacterium]